MKLETIASFAFAATCLTAIAAMSVDRAMAATYGSMESARQNVIQSRHYDRSLETNRAYRQARMRKECGPINDPQLHQSCLASFDQDEPYTRSSTTRRGPHIPAGR
jgi:hypothetical protein